MPRPLDRATAGQILQGFLGHEEFCRESLTIRDKRGIPVPLVLTPAQIKLSRIIRQQQEARRPVRVIALKARQVHMSVGSVSQIFRNVAFAQGQQAMLMAHDHKAASNLYGYLEQFDSSYKPFRGLIKPDLISKQKASQTTAGKLTWARENWVMSATASNLAAGRSFSMRHLLLSEYAFYRDASELGRGLMQSVPDDPGTIIIVESTANGMGGPFYDLWQKASDPNGDSAFAPLFFAWWEHPEYQRQPDPGFTPTREERELAERHGLTLPQLCWRRWAIANKCDGSIDTFRQEYPSNPEEAFLTSGRPRFDVISIGRMPVVRDPIAGELERVNVGVRSQVQFVARDDGRGLLRVWRRPVAGHVYVIGADVAEGIDAKEGKGEADPDYSSGVVLDADTGEQVAHLRGRIAPSVFGEYLCALGEWFNWAYLIPEANGPGLGLIEEINRQGYPFHLIYQRQREADDRRPPLLQELGWKTTSTSKPQLVSALDTAIREMSVIIRDPVIVQECRTFVYRPDGKVGAQEGCHDDCVIALALAVIGLRSVPRQRQHTGVQQIQPQRYGQQPQTTRSFRF